METASSRLDQLDNLDNLGGGACLSFGSLNIDYVYQLPHIVRPGETLTAAAYEIHPGGKGLNQSLAMARAGLSVAHAGRVGKDGLWLCEILRNSGVDTSCVHCCEHEYTGHALIQVAQDGAQGGQNSIVLYSGANRSWNDADIEELFEHPKQGQEQRQKRWQAVVCQNEMNGLATVFRCATERALPVILNAAPYDSSLLELDLSMLHTLLVNETEAMGLAESDELKAAFRILKQRYPQLRLVMTLGADGVRASYRGRDYHLPAYPANVVDSTAAGDTFTGYYAASILQHQPDDMEAALVLGSQAAALAVGRAGAAPSIPQISELRKSQA